MQTSAPAAPGASSSAPVVVVNVAAFGNLDHGPALWVTVEPPPKAGAEVDSGPYALAIALERELRDTFIEMAAVSYERAVAGLRRSVYAAQQLAPNVACEIKIVDRGVEQ